MPPVRVTAKTTPLSRRGVVQLDDTISKANDAFSREMHRMTHDLTRYFALADRVPEIKLIDHGIVVDAIGRIDSGLYHEAIGRMYQWLIAQGYNVDTFPGVGRPSVSVELYAGPLSPIVEDGPTLYDALCAACDAVVEEGK